MLKKVAVLALIVGLALGILLLTADDETFEVENSLTIGRPTAEIWKVLTEVEGWPSWWPGMQTVRLTPGWREGATLDLLLKGTPEKEPARVVSVVVERELAWARAGVLRSFTRTSLRLEAHGDTTRVSLRSFIRGPQAILARFTGREAFAKYHEAVLAGLKAFLTQEKGN